jgi:hypothetical protein
MVKTYGEYYGKLISEEKVVIGMTPDMCKAAWGYPMETNTTTLSGLSIEQWVYSMRTYLYFKNGKLAIIQN